MKHALRWIFSKRPSGPEAEQQQVHAQLQKIMDENPELASKQDKVESVLRNAYKAFLSSDPPTLLDHRDPVSVLPWTNSIAMQRYLDESLGPKSKWTFSHFLEHVYSLIADRDHETHAKALFALVKTTFQVQLLQATDESVLTIQQLKNFVSKLASIYVQAISSEAELPCSTAFIEFLMRGDKPEDIQQDLVCVPQQFKLAEFTKWLHQHKAFAKLANNAFLWLLVGHLDSRIERQRHVLSTATLLRPEELWFLLLHIPPSTPVQTWQVLYSTKKDGQSWHQFSSHLLNEQVHSTLFLFQDSTSQRFGAFTDTPWKLNPQFTGSNAVALFSLDPVLRWYSATGYNSNYQYLMEHSQSLPNGLGFGGQLSYFGLYIDADFLGGHSFANPISSTFGNPRLSADQDFKLESAEVLLIEKTEMDDRFVRQEERQGLSAYGEASDFLEMAGRKMYGKDVRAEDEANNMTQHESKH